METDRHYFIEGLFIIGCRIAAALFFVWLAGSGHRDDVLYRIHFTESVSGLALGDPVKFRGVDVGTVKAMAIDAADPRRVQVDVKLRKDAPVKTDTKASLKLKGITGVVFIELNGGSAEREEPGCRHARRPDPGNPLGKEQLSAPCSTSCRKSIEKFSALEDQSRKVLTDVGGLTGTAQGKSVAAHFPAKGKGQGRLAEKVSGVRRCRGSAIPKCGPDG